MVKRKESDATDPKIHVQTAAQVEKGDFVNELRVTERISLDSWRLKAREGQQGSLRVWKLLKGWRLVKELTALEVVKGWESREELKAREGAQDSWRTTGVIEGLNALKGSEDLWRGRRLLKGKRTREGAEGSWRDGSEGRMAWQ
jgi:hypothetical protein